MKYDSMKLKGKWCNKSNQIKGAIPTEKGSKKFNNRNHSSYSNLLWKFDWVEKGFPLICLIDIRFTNRFRHNWKREDFQTQSIGFRKNDFDGKIDYKLSS